MKQDQTKPLSVLEEKTTGPVISKPVLFQMSDNNDVVFSTKYRNDMNLLVPENNTI